LAADRKLTARGGTGRIASDGSEPAHLPAKTGARPEVSYKEPQSALPPQFCRRASDRANVNPHPLVSAPFLGSQRLSLSFLDEAFLRLTGSHCPLSWSTLLDLSFDGCFERAICFDRQASCRL